MCPPPRPCPSVASPHQRLCPTLAVVLALAFLWTYWPVIPGLVAQWWNEPEYSHGFLIPLVSAALIWSKRDALRAAPVAPGYWGLALMALALLVYIAGSVGADLFLQRVSLVMMLAGGVMYVAGVEVLRIVAVPSSDTAADDSSARHPV